MTKMKKFPDVKFYLYYEKSRTFHPKLYLFSNEDEKHALIIVGSSNWSHGGFVDNVEVNVIVNLDLTIADHKACLDNINQYFINYWQETK